MNQIHCAPCCDNYSWLRDGLELEAFETPAQIRNHWTTVNTSSWCQWVNWNLQLCSIILPLQIRLVCFYVHLLDILTSSLLNVVWLYTGSLGYVEWKKHLKLSPSPSVLQVHAFYMLYRIATCFCHWYLSSWQILWLRTCKKFEKPHFTADWDFSSVIQEGLRVTEV